MINVEGDYDEIVASIKVYPVGHNLHGAFETDIDGNYRHLNYGLFSICNSPTFIDFTLDNLQEIWRRKLAEYRVEWNPDLVF